MKILDQERRLMGLTIADLAYKLNVSNASIHFWKKGQLPSPKNVKKLKDMGFSDAACNYPWKEVE